MTYWTARHQDSNTNSAHQGEMPYIIAIIQTGYTIITPVPYIFINSQVHGTVLVSLLQGPGILGRNCRICTTMLV